ncbi:MAG: glycosyltransferase [Erysipelotrichaceae bacterium]|nr:glycosyltransferase [Erysipelotrichaceae bacterium]
MSNELVSVIIPTYKGSDSICVALESLAQQTYKNIQVIVSDDNGPGESEQLKTQEIVDIYKSYISIDYLINEHVNGSHARNEGLKKAKGEYVCFLDDDDFFLNDYIEKAVTTLSSNNECSIVFFNVVIASKDSSARIVSNEEIDYRDILFSTKEIGTGSNLFFRKNIYEETGGFDERYLRFQDFEFVTKKLKNYKSIWIKENKIVKFFNKTDNYLNYQKSLQMQELYRNDSLEHGLINDEELSKMRSVQQHNLYKDMLARYMPKEDVRNVYDLLLKNNDLSFSDKAMWQVYKTSKAIFKAVLGAYMYLVYGKSNNNGSEYLEFRTELQRNYLRKCK